MRTHAHARDHTHAHARISLHTRAQAEEMQRHTERRENFARELEVLSKEERDRFKAWKREQRSRDAAREGLQQEANAKEVGGCGGGGGWGWGQGWVCPVPPCSVRKLQHTCLPVPPCMTLVLR